MTFQFYLRLSVHHSEKDKEFYINLEEKNGTRTKAYLKYIKSSNVLDLRSTVVPKAFEGKAVIKLRIIFCTAGNSVVKPQPLRIPLAKFPEL